MIDPTINDYLQGKIYKLVSNQTSDIYIGSTKNTLARRFKKHQSDYNTDITKRQYRKAFELLKYDDVRIELIEDFPTSSKFFLELREGRLILDMNCINDVVPRKKYQNLDPDKMIDPTIDDYLNGKIYKLTSSHTSDIYIGSTIMTLTSRFSNHKKSNDTTASHILKYDDVKIELLEAYPTTSQYLLLSRERYWIEKLNCVNYSFPTRTQQEYKNDNKDKIKQYREDNKEIIKKYRDEHKTEAKEYNKKYREDNKEKISKQKKQYRDANKDKILETALYHKKYQQDNKEKIAKQRKLAAQKKKELK